MADLNQVDFIGIHHTSVEHNQDVETIHNFHFNTNGWLAIGYHFYIMQGGEIYEGRPLNKRGAHIRGENHRSIGVCVAGNFDVQDIIKDFPEQYQSLVKLLRWLKSEYPHANIKPHTHFSGKTCPGSNFPMDKLINDVNNIEEGYSNYEYEIKLWIGKNEAELNGQVIDIDQGPIIDKESSRALIPVRFVSTELGANVDWDGDKRLVTVSDNNKTIKMAIGDKKVDINGNIYELDLAPQIKNNRTLVPLRMISQELGFNVDYDPDTQRINIYK